MNEIESFDRDACYRALRTRDGRFDGRFYTAVVTTGIYCRPICPVRPPKLENCIFLPSAAAAQAAGFRACLRCRPELAPGVASWRGTANTVSRALALIAEGARNDGDGVEALATRLGVGGRHLRRLFERHLGASPVAVAQTQRILFAKKLIGETDLTMTEVASAAGFGSIRRFNAAMRKVYDRPPRSLRRQPTRASAASGDAIQLSLSYTKPYDWPAILGFLGTRAIPGIETVEDGVYRRTIALDDASGLVEVEPDTARERLIARIRLSKVTALATVVDRLRRLFDLDADIAAIGRQLSQDPLLAPALAARPGLRVPGAWDGFELAVRAILGQQVSVAGARTLAGRLVARFGRPYEGPGASPDEGLSLLFPTPAALAEAEVAAIGMPGARARALSGLAKAFEADPDLLRPFDSLAASVETLCALPGVGPWTAHYIAMRALGEPDAFPASDLGLLRALAAGGPRPSPAEAEARAESWRPWRAYALFHLWMMDAEASANAGKAAA